MSATLQGATYYLPLPKGEKLLLCALADHANDDGAGVYPGNERLATKTSDSVRNVQRLLRSLERAQLIARVAHAEGGRGRAVEWAINAPFIYNVARANGWTATSKRVRSMSPFTDEKGDTTAPKPRHHARERVRVVSPQPLGSIKNRDDDIDDGPLITELNPRHPGEDLGVYLRRIADLHRQANTTVDDEASA